MEDEINKLLKNWQHSVHEKEMQYIKDFICNEAKMPINKYLIIQCKEGYNYDLKYCTVLANDILNICKKCRIVNFNSTKSAKGVAMCMDNPLDTWSEEECINLICYDGINCHYVPLRYGELYQNIQYINLVKYLC